MSQSSNQLLIDQWRDQPAPLLGLLHAFHSRDGYLSEEALRDISQGLRIPIADLFGTVTFYHHFWREPGGLDRPRVCTGPVCKLKGADRLLEELQPDGAKAMPCCGRCDEPVPVIWKGGVMTGISLETLSQRPSPLPAPNPGGYQECVFERIREPDRASIAGYLRTDGYQGLRRALEMSPEKVVEVIDESKLAGRGGAGFPTGRKWKAVAEAAGEPKYVVCNADEGEPGCFKDRVLMEHDPHAVIEGMLVAGYASGASEGYIYLRYEYPEIEGILMKALGEARRGGLLGRGILESDFDFEIYLRRGAGAYICGEEGSLLNSLEGKHPFPRNRPPFPVTHGYLNRPTAVNNVETLVSAPPILRKGAGWYRELGLDGRPGTKVVSLSGDVLRPGNYEVPFGLSLRTLLEDWAGGAPGGREIQAVTMAGLSGGFLAREGLDAALDEESVREHGAMLGAAGIMVFDDSRDMVDVARQAMEFFAEESCGKCFPCRIGTHRITERLAGEAGPGELEPWLEEIGDMSRAMKATSACGLGMAAPLIAESLIRYFPDQVEAHVESADEERG